MLEDAKKATLKRVDSANRETRRLTKKNEDLEDQLSKLLLRTPNPAARKSVSVQTEKETKCEESKKSQIKCHVKATKITTKTETRVTRSTTEVTELSRGY